MVIRISGQTFKDALENGVSTWPRYEGKWPFVSGVKFCFDPKKPPGQRIEPEDIKTKNGPLDLNKDYTLICKSFVAFGADGYTSLAKGTKDYVIDKETAPLLIDILTKFFESFSSKYKFDKGEELVR